MLDAAYTAGPLAQTAVVKGLDILWCLFFIGLSSRSNEREIGNLILLKLTRARGISLDDM